MAKQKQVTLPKLRQKKHALKALGREETQHTLISQIYLLFLQATHLDTFLINKVLEIHPPPKKTTQKHTPLSHLEEGAAPQNAQRFFRNLLASNQSLLVPQEGRLWGKLGNLTWAMGSHVLSQRPSHVPPTTPGDHINRGVSQEAS